MVAPWVWRAQAVIFMLPRCPSFKNTSQSFRSALIVFTRLIIRLRGRQMKKNSSMQRHAAYEKALCMQSHPIASSSSTTLRNVETTPSTAAERNATHEHPYRPLQEARNQNHQYLWKRAVKQQSTIPLFYLLYCTRILLMYPYLFLIIIKKSIPSPDWTGMHHACLDYSIKTALSGNWTGDLIFAAVAKNARNGDWTRSMQVWRSSCMDFKDFPTYHTRSTSYASYRGPIAFCSYILLKINRKNTGKFTLYSCIYNQKSLSSLLCLLPQAIEREGTRKCNEYVLFHFILFYSQYLYKVRAHAGTCCWHKVRSGKWTWLFSLGSIPFDVPHTLCNVQLLYCHYWWCLVE